MPHPKKGADHEGLSGDLTGQAGLRTLSSTGVRVDRRPETGRSAHRGWRVVCVRSGVTGDVL